MKQTEFTVSRTRYIRIFTFTVLACAFILAGLYASFVWQVKTAANNASFAEADAIVVLTGENSRVQSAISLLHAKHGERLLISGVNRNVSKDTLEHSLRVDPSAFSCCVDLDYLSLDTKGNAKNASYWAKYHDFKSLIVVTSDYHMPRSLVMMQRAMPRVKLIPAPVPSPDFDMTSFSGLIASPKVLKEFGKYLIVQIGMEPAAKYLLTATLTSDSTGKSS